MTDLTEYVKPLPSHERLNELFRYDNDTGVLYRKVRVMSQKSGSEAFTTKDRRGYRHGKVDGTNYQAHRIIWKMVYGVDPDQIDHINGNPSDNRLENLRSCTNAENSRNYRKSGGTSKFRGVCWGKRDKKWVASISIGGGRKKSLGYYDDESEAARAYDSAARIYHGEFATLNFPKETTPCPHE